MSDTNNAKLTGKQKLNAFAHKLFGSTPGDGEMQPKEGFSFSICGFGQNLICTIIGSYLTVFMTDAIGFQAMWVAFLMLFARIFDAANDPIMGSIVDRTRTRWGKCRPYLKWMAIPIAIMTIICFLPVYPNSPGGFAAICVVYVIWGIIYTIADVPYWGLSTAMSNDTYRRGNLLTIARLICTLGAGIVTIFVPIITDNITASIRGNQDVLQGLNGALLNAQFELTKLLENPALTLGEFQFKLQEIGNIQAFIDNLHGYVGAGQIDADILTSLVKAFEEVQLLNTNLVNGATIVDGASLNGALNAVGDAIKYDLRMTYFTIAVICCVVAVPLFFLGFKNTKERNVSVENPPSLGHNLKLLFKNKPLMLIVLSGILGAARLLFTYTGGLYFAKYVMNKESLYSLFAMAVFPGGLVASLLVPWFTRKFGKRNTYIWSHIIGGVAMLVAFIVGIACDKGNYSSTLTTVILMIALVIAGIPSGIGNIVTYAMIGDTVEYLELRTGERAEGICFAMQTFMNKIGMAVGAFVGVLAYELADIKANDVSSVSAQGKDTMWIMLVGVAAISFFLTVIPLFFYKFNEKQQQEAKVELERRKALALENVEVDADESAQIDGAETTVDSDANMVADEQNHNDDNANLQEDIALIVDSTADDKKE